MFIAAFLKPAVWSILGASAILGVCAAVLWTAQVRWKGFITVYRPGLLTKAKRLLGRVYHRQHHGCQPWQVLWNLLVSARLAHPSSVSQDSTTNLEFSSPRALLQNSLLIGNLMGYFLLNGKTILGACRHGPGRRMDRSVSLTT